MMYTSYQDPLSKKEVWIRDPQTYEWMYFSQPEMIFCAYSLDDVLPCLQALNDILEKKTFYAVGFVGYEASPAFDPYFKTRSSGAFPLVWFGVFRSGQKASLPVTSSPCDLRTQAWKPSQTRAMYCAAIERIQKAIEQGETYQANYTFQLQTELSGLSPWECFLDILPSQSTRFSSYIDIGDHVIASFSPELFFQKIGEDITMSPMKGTAERKPLARDDQLQAETLQTCPKNRAENVMIVDMIRNDLTRIALPGTVNVSSLFDVQRFPTVWQMTSTVKAKTRANVVALFSALFPCASITGAPKVETMRLLQREEANPRDLYTGCIGLFLPNGDAQFSIAIRTLLFDQKQDTVSMGIGSGIVSDSLADDEYEECMTKSRFLFRESPSFQLLETMLWEPDKGCFLLNEHLQRMKDSAHYFGFSFSKQAILASLSKRTEWIQGDLHKIRLLLSSCGAISCEVSPLKNDLNLSSSPSKASMISCALHHSSVSSDSLFLYHKTTHRKIYNDALSAFPEVEDVILYNEKDEITECCKGNIVFQLNGDWFTPPLHCGLLPGTFRQKLLEDDTIREAVLLRHELPTCEALYLVNSVRKWQRIELLSHCSRSPNVEKR